MQAPDRSMMERIVERQPANLAAVLEDRAPVEAAKERLTTHRVLLVGSGTSWHAANHGAWLLRHAGVDAWAVPAVDTALYGDWIAQTTHSSCSATAALVVEVLAQHAGEGHTAAQA